MVLRSYYYSSIPGDLWGALVLKGCPSSLQSVHLAVEWHQLACLLPLYLHCLSWQQPAKGTYVDENSCK